MDDDVIPPSSRTHLLTLRSWLNHEPVRPARTHILRALQTRSVEEETALDLDLTHLKPQEQRRDWVQGQVLIEEEVERWLAESVHESTVQHLSIFAFAPLPWLIALGRVAGEAVEMDIYQRHRETQDWCWPEQDGMVTWQRERHDYEPQAEAVGVLLQISAPIPVEAVKSCIPGLPLYGCRSSMADLAKA